MAMSTTRMSLGALLGTITTAANTATSIIQTTANVVQMGDNYISTRLKEQQLQEKLESRDFGRRLVERIATERTERGLELAKYTAQSPSHQRLFDSNFEELMADLKAIEST